jgi:hypothetical protein
MQTLTKTRAYQGRTYQATLANGKQVVLTVAAGPSEIERLQALAVRRYGYEAVGLMNPILRRTVQQSESRWWDVELTSYTEVVEEVEIGYWDCYSEIDQQLIHLDATCPAMIPSRAAQVAPGWEVTGFEQGQPFQPDPDIF